jgi:penicillin-binding protein 1B
MSRRKRFWRAFRFALLAIALLAAGIMLYLDFRVRSEFEGRRFALPARIYARPLELYAGLRIAQANVLDELREAGYREGAREGGSGWFVREGDGIEIAVRPFVFWDGPQPAKRIRVAFDDSAVTAVRDTEGRDLPLARLEPLPIGGIYPANNEDRVLVRLGEVPKHLVQALVANEDRNFYFHYGFDLRGIARAAMSFVRGSGRQGGSTLTQQLVKNFFLTSERTLQRKITELGMAVLVELHYGKEEILEAYVNEIYLGQDRDRAIHGVGLAALYYFGNPVEQLTLAQSALLVGMVKGPALYDPYRHPQRALERRNLVLRETKDRGYVTMEQYAAARATDLGVNPKASVGPRRTRPFSSSCTDNCGGITTKPTCARKA